MNGKTNDSPQRKQNILNIALLIAAGAMIIYQLAYTQALLQNPTGHRVTHLGFALVVVLLSLMVKSKQGRPLKLALLIASILVTGYFMFFLDEIATHRTVRPEMSDLIIGVIGLIVVFIGSYLIYGKTFPVVTIVALVYLILGRFLPFPFTVAAVSAQRVIMWLTAPIATDEGIYGNIIVISANFLFLFIFFGALLHAFGGTRFVIAVGQWIGSKLTSGPAAVAVIGSSLLGTITGSTTANITITGAFTIPMMKEAGYSPDQAGAIEASASNGGQIMPPIMGSTAFVMAGFAGIPYVHIIGAAILPALLYFLGVFFYVQLTAQKMQVRRIAVPVNTKQLLLDAPIFFLPLGVLVFLLIEGFSLPYVGFWGMMTLIAVSLISSIRREARLSFGDVTKKLADGARVASEVAVCCALIGVIATCIKVGGLGIRLPLLIEDISHGILPIALFIAMISSIILGMGLPSIVSYILVAIGAIPALIQMGVPLLQAHFFCMIYAVFAHITPPVATGTLVASQIAAGDYWRTSWEAVKAALTGFLLPFFIVYCSVLVLKPESFTLSIAQIVAILLVISGLQMFLSNYCFSMLNLGERIAFLLASLSCLAFIFSQYYPAFFAGVVVFMLAFAWQWTRRRGKTSPEVATLGT